MLTFIGALRLLPSAIPPLWEDQVMSSTQINGTALLGLALALLTAWQASRAVRSGGSYYDRELYGMTARTHRRVRAAAWVVAGICLVGAFRSPLPFTPLVAVETVGVILYLASFARGASEEE
jgi:hypothetical protein